MKQLIFIEFIGAVVLTQASYLPARFKLVWI
jgi:hypothetical protein